MRGLSSIRVAPTRKNAIATSLRPRNHIGAMLNELSLKNRSAVKRAVRNGCC
jgi:hypothetical protein